MATPSQEDDGCGSVRLRVVGHAFRDARQVEVTAGSCACTAGKVFPKKFPYTPLPQACDSTTASVVAMRRPVPDGCNQIREETENLVSSEGAR